MPLPFIRSTVRHSLGLAPRQWHQELHEHEVPWLASFCQSQVKQDRDDE
jgi:hypothetical protein